MPILNKKGEASVQEQKLTITVRELSDRLGISTGGAYALVKQRSFPAIRVGKKILVPMKDLDNWLTMSARKRKRR